MNRITIILILLLTTSATFAADEAQERRIRSGLRLFGALLAADEDIATKTSSDGKLNILIIYATDQKLAETFAKELEQLGRGKKQGTIRNMPIEVHISNDLSLTSFQKQPPAGIFLLETLQDDELKNVVQFGITNHVIVYSPIEGDVNRGVLGGLAIETRVRPYINVKTLRESKIQIKAFFLKVAKHYEP